MIDKSLLELLACPACKADVKEESDGVVCVDCKRIYPIKNGIPVLLIDEAKKSLGEDK